MNRNSLVFDESMFWSTAYYFESCADENDRTPRRDLWPSGLCARNRNGRVSGGKRSNGRAAIVTRGWLLSLALRFNVRTASIWVLGTPFCTTVGNRTPNKIHSGHFFSFALSFLRPSADCSIFSRLLYCYYYCDVAAPYNRDPVVINGRLRRVIWISAPTPPFPDHRRAPWPRSAHKNITIVPGAL